MRQKRTKVDRHEMVNLPAGRTSSLNKARRLANIAAGNRPRSLVVRDLEGYRPRVKIVVGGLELHPTKGWRRA